MAAAGGEGGAALEATHRGLQAGVPPRLRAFTPALLAYAVNGQVQQAFQVLIIHKTSQDLVVHSNTDSAEFTPSSWLVQSILHFILILYSFCPAGQCQVQQAF